MREKRKGGTVMKLQGFYSSSLRFRKPGRRAFKLINKKH